MHRTSHKSYLQHVVATYEWERSGLKLEKVGLTFSSLAMLLGQKSLKIIDLLEILLCLFCVVKVILLISERTFIMLA